MADQSTHKARATMKDVLKYQGYLGTVHFSAEDEIFYGKLSGVDDLVTFEGDTVPTLKKVFEEAVDDYIELCQSLGKTPSKSFKGSLNVRIKPVLHKKANDKSTELGISLNQFIELAIQDKVDNDKQPATS